MLRFVSCCEAAGPSSPGHYVDADAPIPPRAGPVSEPLPDREFVPNIGTCLHESAHAFHLHARGYRIARAAVGRRNFIERAPGEGARMTSLQQIEAALAGDIGTRYAVFRAISRMCDEEIEPPSLALRQESTAVATHALQESLRATSLAFPRHPTTPLCCAGSGGWPRLT
jgi:hypothetical protein